MRPRVRSVWRDDGVQLPISCNYVCHRPSSRIAITVVALFSASWRCSCTQRPMTFRRRRVQYSTVQHGSHSAVVARRPSVSAAVNANQYVSESSTTDSSSLARRMRTAGERCEMSRAPAVCHSVPRRRRAASRDAPDLKFPTIPQRGTVGCCQRRTKGGIKDLWQFWRYKFTIY